MELKLFDSERRVMEVLWDAAQDLPAREGIDFEPLLGALTPWKGERL